MLQVKKFRLNKVAQLCIFALAANTPSVYSFEPESSTPNSAAKKKKTEKKEKIEDLDTAIDEEKSVEVATEDPIDEADSEYITEDGEDIERIEVTGVRSSILRSLNNKRYASEIIDTISAEDVGQLPDENIAEALQRITGVSLSRAEDGEGQSIQIRGSSDNNIEINGQSVVGSDNARSVNFQDLPSELFSTIEIQKASSADRIEGSLGGTVNLKTRKPLDLNKDSLTNITVGAKYHELADEVSPDYTFFNSTSWRGSDLGDIGFLFTINAKEVVTHDEAFGAASFDGAPSRWVTFTGLSGARDDTDFAFDSKTPYASNLDPNGDGVSNERDIFYVPYQWKVYSNDKGSDRYSGNFTLQWQPNEDLNLWLDGTVTHIDDLVRNSTFSMQGNTSTGTGNPWAADNQYYSFPLASGHNVFEHVNSIADGDIYVMTAGRLGGVNTIMGSSPAISESARETYQFTLGSEYQLNDYWLLSAEASTTESTSETEQSQLFMSHDYNNDGDVNRSDFAAVVDFDERNADFAYINYFDAPLGTTQFNEFVPNDINYDRLTYSQLQRNAIDSKNTGSSVRIDLTHDLDSVITKLKFGYRWAEKTAERIRYAGSDAGNASGVYDGSRLVLPYIANIRVNDEQNYLAQSLNQCLGNVKTSLDSFSGNIPTSWLSTNCTADFIQNQFNIPNIRAINPDTGFPYYQRNSQLYNQLDVTETTHALYARADFNMDWFDTDIVFYGNFGVRYVETDIEGLGWKDTPEDSELLFEQVKITSDYQHSLPSFNGNWQLSDETVMRFAYSKNIARPSLSRVAPNINITYNENLDGDYVGTGTAGNPALKPKEADNADLSLEWYYSDDALLSGAFYYRKINNLAELLPDQTLTIGDEKFLVRQWTNIGATKVKGWEVSWQQSFKGLPGLLSNTGINFNYTRPDEDASLFDGHGEPVVKEGYSKDNYNLTLYYDDKKFSARLAYAYRSEYVRNYNATLGSGRTNDQYRIPQYVDEYGQFDLSANYNINKALKVRFSIVNLTDESAEWYLKYKQMTDRISYTGRKATFTLSYKF